jgi:signal transduction histidine kinase
LAIARRLTELHGGTLGINSMQNVETVVTARFPKAAT